MNLRHWRLQVLVLTAGCFGSFEASSTPAALGWRVAARKTPQNQAWIVNKLRFNTAGGILRIEGPEGCTPIDSGSVSDQFFGGIPGYGPGEIFLNASDSTPGKGWWDGRSKGSLFFVGLQCLTPVIVHSVQIKQGLFGRRSVVHWSAQLSVQAFVADNWTTLFEAQVPPESVWAADVVTVFNDLSISPEAMCAEACKTYGFCCNDPWVGSNQLISCSQACHMRASGLNMSHCSTLCARNTSSGCALSVKGHNYSFCSSCTDLTNSSRCSHGVASQEACFAGCRQHPPTVAVAALPVWQPPARLVVAGAPGTKSDEDKTLLVAVTVPVGILACIASSGLIVACLYRRRKSSDPQADSR
ncbi:unnamed protein product, partial [Polarella glacialis]